MENGGETYTLTDSVDLLEKMNASFSKFGIKDNAGLDERMDLDQSTAMCGGNSSTADVSGKQNGTMSENDLNINSQFHLENETLTKILSE